VTIADRFLAAFIYPMSRELGPYVPLIIVNCMIISRCEVCAQKQSVPTAAADAIGQALGFALALASIATVRELLGAGSWFGIGLFWQSEAAQAYRWQIMSQPPGAFLTLGVLLAIAVALGAVWNRRKKATI
jgi:electron transport complex protein RnfE